MNSARDWWYTTLTHVDDSDRTIRGFNNEVNTHPSDIRDEDPIVGASALGVGGIERMRDEGGSD
jgi:hypothetical protein